LQAPVGKGWAVFSRRFAVVTAVVALLVSAGAGLALDKESVYFRKGRKFSNAAEINAKKIFMLIPAYKEIFEKNIDEESALYLIKLAEANKIFLKAVKKCAEDNSYDIICEEGALKKATNVTEEVAKIVKELTRQ